jgi:hypothetical protein
MTDIPDPPTATSVRPTGPRVARRIPEHLDEDQLARLRSLLEDPDTWVLRPGWEPYILHGDHASLLDPRELTRDHRIAALAWLRQQRHRLHQVLDGGPVAPPGWLESFPLYERLESLI